MSGNRLLMAIRAPSSFYRPLCVLSTPQKLNISASLLRYHSTDSVTPNLHDTEFVTYKIATTVPRLSKLLIPSNPPVTDDPLIKHGYVRQVSSGAYHLLPLGNQVQTNLENILRKHMNSISGVEVSLSTLSSPKLWEKTGRDKNTELFRLRDSNGGNEHILAPTHEEEITNLVANSVSSYRQLPLRLFQITRKYRDEKRPRGGLLRGKEFLMKDMYSFDVSMDDSIVTYKEVQKAYFNFFNEIGVPFVMADACAGSIGGSMSHEFHYVSDVGEDTLVVCDSCKFASNMEKAVSEPPESQRGTETEEANVAYFVSPDENRETLVAAYYPKDREFNIFSLLSRLPEDTVDVEVYENSESVMKQLKKLEQESGESELKSGKSANSRALSFYLNTAKLEDDTSLLTRRLVRVMDPRLSRSTPLPDLPFRANRGSTTTLVDIPLVNAQEGDACPECDSEDLSLKRAIEVGHTFYLGTKYSEPLNAVIRRNGERAETVPIEMGCYGIGVSRLLSAITSITKDSDGLVWPVSVAPYHAIVVSKDATIGAQITDTLRDGADGKSPLINAILDDRPSVSIGASLRDARALGFPATVIVGNKFAETGKVEIQLRNKSVEDLKKGDGKYEVTLSELPFKLSELLGIS